MVSTASQVQCRPSALVLIACAVAIAVAVTLVNSIQPAAASAQATGDVVYEGARLITGDGSAAIENGVIVVRSGVIDAVGASGSVTLPPGARRVDLRGKTVMPMLVNVHGHIGYMKGATTGKQHYSRDNVLDHLRRYAYYGVGAFQSLGTDRDGLELHIRDEQRAGTLTDPDLALLFTANQGIVAPTPGSVNGGPFFAVDVVLEANSPDHGRQLVRTVAARKPDIIKLWVDDRNGTKKKLTPDVYRAIIDEAHALGLRTVAHVYYLDDAKDLVRAGIDGLAHMVRAAPGVDTELARMMKARHVFACSTLSIQKGVPDGPGWLDDPALAESVRPEVIAQWKAEIAKATPEAVAQARAGYAMLERSLKLLVDAGARVTLCGDTGLNSQTPGFTEHRELEAMAQAGMPPLEVIRAATQVGAAILGLTDRGTLAPGKRADFVVLDANPLERMANSRRISAVYRAGVAIDRAALRARWTGAPPAAGPGIGQPR